MDFVSLTQRLVAMTPALLQGAWMTLAISLAAIVLGFVGGATLLGLRQSLGRLSAFAVATYVSFFRGTPLLVQLLMMFYLPSAAGVELSPVFAAVTAMALNSSAFQCEILRAGRAAIAPGQIEAARTFGLDARKIFFFIELPQILRAVWPAIVSEAVDVLKGSAIVSVIAVTELARAGRQVAATTYRPLEAYMAVAATYLVLTLTIQWIGRVLQRRRTERRPAAALATQGGRA